MRCLTLITAGLMGLSCLSGFLNAQTDDSGKKALQPKVEMLTAKVQVVDPDGNPIEGATVTPSGLRSKAKPGTHWWWRSEKHGEQPKKETDSNGIVEMPYPKYVIEEMETDQVTWTVSHPDFIYFRKDFSVDKDPAEIQMKRGLKIAVSAIDGETGEKLTKNLYAVAGNERVNWQLKDNGVLVSGTMVRKKRFLRVIELVEGEPTRFSERIEINPGEKSRVFVKDVKLSVGTRVIGKLDESVTRPVTNGYVVASVARRPVANVNDRGTRWSWHEKTKIREDGTFVFESMPSDEVLQMIPVCDVWVPQTPNANEIAPFFPALANRVAAWAAVPSLLKLEGKEVAATLKMVKAKKVRVTVVGPDDQPIGGAKVGCSPNQKWFDGGAQIYGEGFSMSKALIELRAGNFEPERRNRYFVETDENGIAEFVSVPDNPMSKELYVEDDNFELPIAGRGRTFKYKFDASDVTEVTLRLQEKGTEVMDGSQMLAEQKQRNTFRRAVETVSGWLQSLF